MIKPRQTVREIEAYKPPLEGRRGRVRLDFNENTTGFPWAASGLPQEAVGVYPEYTDFLEKLSSHLKVPVENLMLTNGTGEAIFLAAFTFIEPCEDAALTSSPTFALIPHYLNLVGAELREVPVTADLQFDIEKIETELEKGVKLAIFASPENPTGATIDPDIFRGWCKKYPETLFIIDEAYAEYNEATALPYALELDNLLVLRTFSKAWAMPGLRLGVVAGNPGLLNYMMRVRAPYSVNASSVQIAMNLMERSDEVRGEAKALRGRAGPLLKEIEERGYGVHFGAGNFYLLKVGRDAKTLCDFCAERGVLIRDRSMYPGMEGMIRITIGTDDENNKLLQCLDEFRDSYAVIFDLDDTLVDTSRSFDATVIELVKRHSDKPLDRAELLDLRAEGGFNDDWDATVELLRRRGVAVTRGQIAGEGVPLYLELARENEDLFIKIDLLKKLAKRYRLFIATGRTRPEYEPLWAGTFGPVFEKVYCKDDTPGLPPKPAPDVLQKVIENHGLAGGLYVGNSIDDMKSAAGAGLDAIAVATNTEAALLAEAGAALVLDSPSDIGKVFML
ncbi:MAG: aminotransferase class I/II-fold pyridoxal phosphate-dependent enzyme [Planctomycetota bacterium]|nr:MAG: aminotransferase class I/II-fold pyridoxal phosphate-dependent enzyme [Planctomycetota bacterium]